MHIPIRLSGLPAYLILDKKREIIEASPLSITPTTGKIINKLLVELAELRTIADNSYSKIPDSSNVKSIINKMTQLHIINQSLAYQKARIFLNMTINTRININPVNNVLDHIKNDMEHGKRNMNSVLNVALWELYCKRIELVYLNQYGSTSISLSNKRAS